MLGWRVTSCRRTLTTTTGVTADRGGAGWRVGGDNEAVQHRRRKVSAVVSHVSQLIVVFFYLRLMQRFGFNESVIVFVSPG